MLINGDILIRPEGNYVSSSCAVSCGRMRTFGFELVTGQYLEVPEDSKQRIIILGEKVKTSVSFSEIKLDTLVFVPYLRPGSVLLTAPKVLSDIAFPSYEERKKGVLEDSDNLFLNSFEPPDFYEFRCYLKENGSKNFTPAGKVFLEQIQNLAFQFGIPIEIKEHKNGWYFHYVSMKKTTFFFDQSGVYIPVRKIWRGESRMFKIKDTPDHLLYTAAGIVRG